MDNDADLALVERCRNGDWAAFTELVVRYQRPIYNAAFWVLRKPEDANDITAKTEALQTAFHKVSEAMYERSRAEQAAQEGEPAASAGNGAPSEDGASAEEDVVDAEVVDEDPAKR